MWRSRTSTATGIVTWSCWCAPLLDQTVMADASGVDYFWSTSLPYRAVRGVSSRRKTSVGSWSTFFSSVARAHDGQQVADFVVDVGFGGNRLRHLLAKQLPEAPSQAQDGHLDDILRQA